MTLATPDPIAALQAEMLKLPQYEPPTGHIFHGGMYCRQTFFPAGATIIGKRHKRPHFFMVVFGDVAIGWPDGRGHDVVKAPFLKIGTPGDKRALWALTDVLFMTIHATRAKTVAGAERFAVEADPTSPIMVGNRFPEKALT